MPAKRMEKVHLHNGSRGKGLVWGGRRVVREWRSLSHRARELVFLERLSGQQIVISPHGLWGVTAAVAAAVAVFSLDPCPS